MKVFVSNCHYDQENGRKCIFVGILPNPMRGLKCKADFSEVRHWLPVDMIDPIGGVKSRRGRKGGGVGANRREKGFSKGKEKELFDNFIHTHTKKNLAGG